MLLQSPSVDCQHAIIEYRDVDETFALQDLNTTYGTYVNDCRIGNAYVRLYPGDVIRFGNSNTSYELVIHGESSVSGYNLEYHFVVCHLLKVQKRRRRWAYMCLPVIVINSKQSYDLEIKFLGLESTWVQFLKIWSWSRDLVSRSWYWSWDPGVKILVLLSRQRTWLETKTESWFSGKVIENIHILLYLKADCALLEQCSIHLCTAGYSVDAW